MAKREARGGIVVEAGSMEQARVLGAALLQIPVSAVRSEVVVPPDTPGGLYRIRVTSAAGSAPVLEPVDASLPMRTENEIYRETMDEVDRLLDGMEEMDPGMLRSIKDLASGLNTDLGRELEDRRLEAELARLVGSRLDGRMEIQRIPEEGKLMLLFFPPQPGGKPMEPMDAARRIAETGAVVPRVEKLVEILEKVRRLRGGFVRHDIDVKAGSFALRPNDSGMWCLLDLYPPDAGGNQVSRAEIVAAARRSGITASLDEAAIDRAIRQLEDSKDPVLGILIAEGSASVAGEDGRVEWKIPVVSYGELEWKIPSELEPLVVEQGQVIAVRHPPRAGTPGANIHGTPIPPEKGRESTIELGAGVAWRGVEAAAAVSGRVVIEGRRVVVLPYRPGSMEVAVAKDGMSADLILTPGVGIESGFRFERALELLREKGVTHGIEEEDLRALVDRANRASKTCRDTVAIGDMPLDGEPGYVETATSSFFDELHARETLNPRERTAVRAVRKGDPVARILQPIQGRAGSDVRGNPIKPKHYPPLQYRAGPGVEQIGNEYRATRDGHFLVSEGAFRVDEIFHHSGDLTVEIGHVRHPGSVIIDGSVGDAYEIDAGGEILVRDNVGASILQSASNIRIGNGVFARSQGRLSASGSVDLNFAEYASISAGGDIRIVRYALQCRIESEGEIRIDGKERGAVGGLLVARRRVVAVSLGSPGAVPTRIVVGRSPRLMAEALKGEQEFHRVREELSQILALEARLGERAGDADEAILRRITAVKITLKERLRKIGLARVALHKDMQNAEPGEVIASGAVYPGTSVTIRGMEYRVNSMMRSVRFRAEPSRSEIVIEPWSLK